jgi:phospholipid/cholesterol/gamma-HCH transport system permease protein
MTAKAPTLTTETRAGQDVLVLGGDWILDHAGAFSKLSIPPSIPALDASAMGRMDTWGMLQLKELIAKAQGRALLNDRQKKILDFMPDDIAHPERVRDSFSFADIFIAIGKASSEAYKTFYGVVSFIGEIFLTVVKSFLNPRGFRFHSIVRHIDETGLRAVPIISLLAVLITMVISYQAADQLTKFGANIFTVDLTVLSLLREMAVLITAIMVAGRSGSAFAAEIGVMKMREEVDALRTMGFNPIEVLVVPRLIAMMITLPILTFIADIVGLTGGAVISTLLLDIPLGQYVDRVQSVATPMMFFIGIIKAPVFAFVITLVGTYQGMNVSGSAESVGKLTTLSVVQSIFLVIVIDAIFSVVFAQLGI